MRIGHVQHYSRGLFLAGVLLCLTVIGGCQSFEQSRIQMISETGWNAGFSSRINCFLNLREPNGPGIRMEGASFEIYADNQWLPVNSQPIDLDSATIGATQVFLGGLALPPGQYERLRLSVKKAVMLKSDGRYLDIAPEPLTVEMNLGKSLELEESESETLLFVWDVENSLLADNGFSPDVVVNPALRQMLQNLVFVSCPDIDTVFVLRSDNKWVVDSFGIKGRPTYLALDSDPLGQRLYVLTSRDRMIKVVDLSTFRVVDFFQVLFNDAPTFMTLGPNGESAYLVDERNGFLSRINLTSGLMEARVMLGNRPRYAAYLEELNLLAVTLSLSQKVVLLDPESLDINRNISTGNSPSGVGVLDGQIYIADSGDNAVSVVNLLTGRDQSRIMVGFEPRRLLVTTNQIYVSNFLDGTLSVLEPGQLGVFQEIFGLGRPFEMSYDSFYHQIYVTDEKNKALGIIDVNANRLLGFIHLGAVPRGMAVIQ